MLHAASQVYAAYEPFILGGLFFASLILITETVSDYLKRR